MQLLKFKVSLLNIMGYFNGFASILCTALAFDNWDKSTLLVIFMGMAAVFIVLCVLCLYGREVESNNLKKAEEEKKRALQESLRRMREALKEERKD